MTKKEKYQLVENYIIENQNTLYRLAYSYVKNKENALDIVQESIFKALKSIDQLNEIGYLKTWLYRIVINTSLDFIKKHGRMQAMDDDVLHSFMPEQRDVEKNYDLYEAIDHLKEPYKTIIVLRYFEDLKIDEIAEIQNENTNTIKTRLYAALRKLRIKMEEKVEA
ncbi:RNA polymerase sigma factor [Psychrobacillus vulpis]|uniref:Sigma-70 family RNA polymerase sigma factor n=1 Tax=Psychrobacillus vulpis TaxID=2325572 RepID=A0A544TVR7_9BACI|nr:sigma-70 family RNA polymerase sigma factor [Psychrobacillus vulpis]TQR21543.1 sigma-70 family RNA polymerase sigma factor [Psychrobacillus vulpis]